LKMNMVIAAGVTLVVILGPIILLIVLGFMLSVRTKQRMTPSSAASLPAGSTTAPAPAKKDEAKKIELAFSWWILLYVFMAVAYIIPRIMGDRITNNDTWLLIIGVAVAATYVVTTAIKYYVDLDTATSNLNKAAAGLAILGFVLLLWQNNFSTTATLKDVGAMTGKVTDGAVEWLAGKNTFRPSAKTRTSTNTGAPAVPAGAPPSVVVPACGEGWSKVVPLPAHWNVTSSWNMDTVQAAWRENGEWKQFEGKYLTGSFDAVRYCAKNRSYAGEDMLLTWTVR
jgi:hypothetical protein